MFTYDSIGNEGDDKRFIICLVIGSVGMGGLALLLHYIGVY